MSVSPDNYREKSKTINTFLPNSRDAQRDLLFIKLLNNLAFYNFKDIL